MPSNHLLQYNYRLSFLLPVNNLFVCTRIWEDEYTDSVCSFCCSLHWLIIKYSHMALITGSKQDISKAPSAEFRTGTLFLQSFKLRLSLFFFSFFLFLCAPRLPGAFLYSIYLLCCLPCPYRSLLCVCCAKKIHHCHPAVRGHWQTEQGRKKSRAINKVRGHKGVKKQGQIWE